MSAETSPQQTPDDLIREDGFFTARDGLQLFWRKVSPQAPKAHVLFVHGYSDHSGRYPDLFRELVDAGYAVHAFDYRGHGRAGGRRGHVDRFDEFVGDLEDMFERVRREVPEGQRLFVVAHSHGGLITTKWLLKRPQGFAGVVLSCPFFRLGFEPPAVKLFVSKLIGRVYPGLHVANELEAEKLSSDPAAQERTKKDPLYLNVTTPRWFTEAMSAQEEVLRRASEIVNPLLVLQSGGDRIVDPAASREWFDAVTSSDKTFEGYEGFQHEPFNEVERARPIGDVIAWLDSHL